MKGPHDDKLEQLGHWPLRGAFTIELLSQLNDSDHQQISFNQWNAAGSDRVLKNTVALHEWAYTKLISHDIFFHHNDTKYLVNDTLYFNISYKESAHLKHQVTTSATVADFIVFIIVYILLILMIMLISFILRFNSGTYSHHKL